MRPYPKDPAQTGAEAEHYSCSQTCQLCFVAANAGLARDSQNPVINLLDKIEATLCVVRRRREALRR